MKRKSSSISESRPTNALILCNSGGQAKSLHAINPSTLNVSLIATRNSQQNSLNISSPSNFNAHDSQSQSDSQINTQNYAFQPSKYQSISKPKSNSFLSKPLFKQFNIESNLFDIESETNYISPSYSESSSFFPWTTFETELEEKQLRNIPDLNSQRFSISSLQGTSIKLLINTQVSSTIKDGKNLFEWGGKSSLKDPRLVDRYDIRNLVCDDSIFLKPNASKYSIPSFDSEEELLLDEYRFYDLMSKNESEDYHLSSNKNEETKESGTRDEFIQFQSPEVQKEKLKKRKILSNMQKYSPQNSFHFVAYSYPKEDKLISKFPIPSHILVVSVIIYS